MSSTSTAAASVEDDSETKNSDAQQDLPQRTFLDTNGIFGYMIKTSFQTARNLYHWIIRKKKNLFFIIPCAAFALAVIVGCLTNDGTLLQVSSRDPDPAAPFWIRTKATTTSETHNLLEQTRSTQRARTSLCSQCQDVSLPTLENQTISTQYTRTPITPT